MSLRDMSFRLKLPLCMIGASAITAIVAIIVVSWEFHTESKENHIEHNHVLGNTMLNMLSWSIKNNDTWHAYALLRGHEQNSINLPHHTFVLFDNQSTVFASNQPVKFPTATKVNELDTNSDSLSDSLLSILSTHHMNNMSLEKDMLSSFPLISDGIVVGHLVIIESYDSIHEMLNDITTQGVVAILITIGLLTPLAWYWGRRIVNPLLQLDACILKIGKEPLDNIHCLVPSDKNEIGRLSQHFQTMIADLKKKSEMEKQIVRSDRLAAIGTLAAGVAHEINNPLAGMIMALDTYKQRCGSSVCPVQSKAMDSIALVERGLTQVQDTVGALLVSVNVDDKPLTSVDIEDTVKLVTPESRSKSIEINLYNGISDSLNIPSTSIRQVLINLLLNAISAANNNGHIDCSVYTESDSLLLVVKNDGDMISETQMEHLFEPYYSSKNHGAGLGLWVTYQIIHSLKGSISVKSEDPWTTFEVVIPLSNKESII